MDTSTYVCNDHEKIIVLRLIPIPECHHVDKEDK